MSDRADGPDDMGDPLILVNSLDEVQGSRTKMECHQGDGILHRAFSVFIMNEAREVLLQRRSRSKLLWPHYWSNSCCSHPRSGEDMSDAVSRRVREELGIVVDLRYLYKFQYHARYKEVGSENELCWVWWGMTGDRVVADANEIEEWRYVRPEDLDEELINHTDRFTPWMQMEWPRLRRDHPDVWHPLRR